MVVSERAINNIMGGMENTAGVRLHSHRHKLKQRFDIIRKLGQGTYGKVQLAINKETGQEVAIKTIKKAKIETEQDLIRIRREIQIMSSVQHPQIIHIYEVFENREKMVLVMEYAAGGELYDYLSERKVLPEEEARRVFRQVASAVYYCHKHKICHRDLKLENILLDLEGNAKIADFGLSNVFDEKQRLDTFCGSPLYASPEIVKGVPYVGPEVDCWSLGVLLYTLVYGAMPFDGTNFRRLVKQITQGDFYEPATPATASELVRQMLTTQSQERATVEDICSHWWVNEGYPVSCLTEAEKLANQTPVRLDLLLSLAPKQISSEHMLIQPEEDASTQANAETAPVIKIPPPPPSEVNDDLGASPQKSSTFGTVTSSATGESVIEEKDKTKKEVASKKPPSIPPSNDDEKKAVKKKEPIDKDKIKKREASTERERSKIKKREPSTDRERVKSKSRDVSMDRATSKVRERSVEKPKTREEANDRPESARTKEKLRSERSSAERVKDQEKTVKKTELSSSRGSIRRPSTPKSGNQGESPSTRVKSKVESESKEKSSPKKSSESPKSTTSKPESKTSKVPEDIDDTEKILKETAAKIENVERLMNEEAKAADVQPMSPSSKEPPSPVTPITSPRNSISSSQAPSPVRSRTGSESSTEVNKSGSRSDSRRQSKILSKAAMFEAGLSQSPSADKPKKSHVTRPGTLNMTDLAKKFEEKPTTEKKNRVVTPNKVSDAKRAFEAKSEAGSRIVSVSSGKDESTSVSPKDSPKGSLSPTSPTTDQISSVPSSTTKIRETTSPVKKVVKSVSKEFSRDSSPKKEKSPTLSKVSKAVSKESKTVAKPTKPVVSQSQVSTKSRPTDLPKPSVESVPVSSVATSKPKSSESSESESETEKVLKEVAEKRERVEMAKKAKLKSALDNSSTKSADRIPSNQGLEIDSAVPAGRQDNIAQSRDVNESKDIAVRSSSHTKVPAVRRIPVVKEVVPIPPEQVLAPTPRSPTEEIPRPIQKTEFINETPTKKSQVEIVLKKQAPERHPMASQISQNASRKEIRNEKSGVFSEAHPEPHLQRARRERIIPIMIEQDDRDDAIEADIRSGSSRSSVTSNTSSIPKSSDSVIGIGRSQRKPQPSATIESIKKSRRERIIPIAVEGEGMMSPVISESGNSDTGKPIQESLSRNRAFNLDRADSFSSAGEDEEDEDDGFQILTAESLFSTLLSRVRSLTRKMANDDGRIVPINHVGTHRQEAPGSAEGPGNGTFWSSLYSPTRETGAGRVAGVLSRGSSQERDLFGDLGHPFWGRTTSRDGSDADSNTSDQSGPFSTLPRADFFRQPSLNWHHHKLIRDRFFSDFTRT